MDTISLTLLATTILGILIFWRIGAFHRLVHNINFIRENGWEEYCASRKRYDDHMKWQQNAPPSKAEMREAKKQMIKRNKLRK